MPCRSLALAAAVILVLGTLARPALADDAPLRIATLVPGVEGLVRGLGDRARLVASVRSRSGGPIAGDAHDLGSPHAPNFEVLHATNPDLVVIDGVVHATVRERLVALGQDVLELDTRSVEGTFRGLAEIERRSGGSGELVDRARARLDAKKLREPLRSLTLFLAPGTPMVVTPRTWLGDLLARVGFEDVAAGIGGDERFPGFVTLSDEVLTTLEPEIVLLVAHGQSEALRDAFLKRMAAGGAWTGVARSAGERVVVLDPQLFSANPCLEMPRAAQWLVEHAGGSELVGSAR